VAQKDRMDAKGTIFYLKELLACESRVNDPLDDIQLIFEKIQTWKEKAGDTDE
jgi:hypothetical protein